jgi:hypothetical protein
LQIYVHLRMSLVNLLLYLILSLICICLFLSCLQGIPFYSNVLQILDLLLHVIDLMFGCLEFCQYLTISLFLSCNSTLSFYSFSKLPCKFWINLSFSFIICLFLISKLESLNKIFVICTLYYATCWNIVITLLCSSNFASIPCSNPGVWNLGV